MKRFSKNGEETIFVIICSRSIENLVRAGAACAGASIYRIETIRKMCEFFFCVDKRERV